MVVIFTEITDKIDYNGQNFQHILQYYAKYKIESEDY